jgi:hypothetical protein
MDDLTRNMQFLYQQNFLQFEHNQTFLKEKEKNRKKKKKKAFFEGGAAGLSRFLRKKYYPKGGDFFCKTRRA